jgi:hypothetical protein
MQIISRMSLILAIIALFDTPSTEYLAPQRFSDRRCAKTGSEVFLSGQKLEPSQKQYPRKTPSIFIG